MRTSSTYSALAFALVLIAPSLCQPARAQDADKSDWWAFKPAARPSVPLTPHASRITNPIDSFIRTRLAEENLPPSPEATRLTLIRRLSYDLTGLPPTVRESEEFVSDSDPFAYEKLVDRLLASPRYGERWGRHWLDLIHYGETHGYDKDKLRPHAWPYRDYVIRSLNDDKPYSRFVQEQLAGDVLFPDEPDGIVATGFIAAGPWDFVGHVELPISKTDGLIARYNDRDDMVMATMSTFQSLTVHCARCHDHKFDPISQKDYYRLQAVFAGVDRANRPYDPDKSLHVKRRAFLSEKKSLETRRSQLQASLANQASPDLAALDQRIAGVQMQIEAESKAGVQKKSPGKVEASPEEAARRGELEREAGRLSAQRQTVFDTLTDPSMRAEFISVTNELARLVQQLAALPPPNLVYAAAGDFASEGSFVPARGVRPVHLLLRGDVKRPAGLMTPAALPCVTGPTAEFSLPDPNNEGARRAALARWITDRDNLLTRRSIVNRIWQYHFGRGIVETPNDFGHMGGVPTHPELLDWLAFWFMDQGESLKKLHKLIVMSATYRQTSAAPGSPPAGSIAPPGDSDNRMLGRMNRSRLDAECIRDAMLFVSGQLDLAMGGASDRQFFFKDDHSPVYDYTRFEVESPAGRRRSVYRHIVRSVPDPFMDCLDCADPSLLVARRNTTLTALQALATLNDPFVLRQCEHLATRLRAVSPDVDVQMEAACQLAWGRKPSRHEIELLAAHSRRHGLANACRVIFNSTEFVFLD